MVIFCFFSQCSPKVNWDRSGQWLCYHCKGSWVGFTMGKHSGVLFPFEYTVVFFPRLVTLSRQEALLFYPKIRKKMDSCLSKSIRVGTTASAGIWTQPAVSNFYVLMNITPLVHLLFYNATGWCDNIVCSQYISIDICW